MGIESIEDAKSVIANDAATFPEWVTAAGVLSSNRNSRLEDLLACLKRRGLPAEIAGTALYVRTKRPQNPPDITGFVSDHEDWQNYLRQRNLIP